MGRFEWRPSRLLSAAVMLLGVMAAFSCLQSDLPAPIGRPLAVAALGWSAWAAWVEARRPGFELVVVGNGVVRIDDREATDFRLGWRGPLGFMAWRGRNGRRQRRLWLPDTLPAPARRELRLALMRGESARSAGSVAP